jgi:hypothetical protein
MNETRRTVIYVALAVVAVGLAWWLSPPVEITPKELAGAKLGEEFYPDFKDPNEPTSIRVVSFDEARAEKHVFGIEFKNGKWTIPTHHNYPADGADRLAKTAASAIGIKRDEFAGDSKKYHEQFGVIDPLEEELSTLKGLGQRITLSKDDNALMDLIIGKPVKDRAGFHYVRKPKEDVTYVARLDIDLSTKFKDWVETDLLKLNRDDLKEIVLDNYSIVQQNGRVGVSPGEIDKLTRDKPADAWKLDGLDESTEELEVSKINGMLAALDDLRLVGVRPKPKGLRPDLSVDEEVLEADPTALQALNIDMARKGFYLYQDPRTKKLRLFSEEGELHAATNKGVAYTLQFGEVFQGREDEVEIGLEAEKKQDEEAAKPEEKENAEGKQPSRYLFVTTHFDESFIGPRPEKPESPEGLDESAGDAKSEKKGRSGEGPKINPAKSKKSGARTKPPESGAAEEQSESADDKEETCGQAPAVDDPAENEAEPEQNDNAKKEKNEEAKPGDDAAKEEKSEDAAKEGASKDAPAAQPQKSKDELKREYDEKVRKYESDLKSFEEKVTAGKKLVDELNTRFADWYYVISAENFNKLHLSRKELVKEKAPSQKDPSADEKKSDADKPEGADLGQDDAADDGEESKPSDDPFSKEKETEKTSE